jgi:hypothetical protein
MTPVQAMTLAVCVLLVLNGVMGVMAERWRRKAEHWKHEAEQWEKEWRREVKLAEAVMDNLHKVALKCVELRAQQVRQASPPAPAEPTSTEPGSDEVG